MMKDKSSNHDQSSNKPPRREKNQNRNKDNNNHSRNKKQHQQRNHHDSRQKQNFNIRPGFAPAAGSGMDHTTNCTTNEIKRSLLVLHGDRQTGQLLLGRMASLKRKLLKPRNFNRDKRSGTANFNHGDSDYRVQMIAYDGPFSWKVIPGIHNDINHIANNKDVENGLNAEKEEEKEEEELMRTWWHRDGNEYIGLDETLSMLHKEWLSVSSFEGIIGFSRGARLTHLIAILYQKSKGKLFPNLKYIIMASGYGDVPLPTNFPPSSMASNIDEAQKEESIPVIDLPSLHIMGRKDKLIPLESSRSLLTSYVNPIVHEHDGGHHVPMRAADVGVILSFIDSVQCQSSCATGSDGDKDGIEPLDGKNGKEIHKKRFNLEDEKGQQELQYSDIHSHQSETIKNDRARSNSSKVRNGLEVLQHENISQKEVIIQPDEEHAQVQADECESLSLIFPHEFQLLSKTISSTGATDIPCKENDDFEEERPNYMHPITYTIQLKPPPDQIEEDQGQKSFWPIKDVALKVQYTPTYPDSPPKLSLHHDMNLLEFKLCQSQACLDKVRAVAETEMGMPCIMSCVYAAKEFFEGGGMLTSLESSKGDAEVGRVDTECDNSYQLDEQKEETEEMTGNDGSDKHNSVSTNLKPSSADRIEKCILQGLDISRTILGHPHLKHSSSDEMSLSGVIDASETVNINISGRSGKGGSWKYTIGLVGKPSAGKSTFFNAASAFARQRGDDGMASEKVHDEDGVMTALGGATMAPHPFTTIDPNIGYCLVPAPMGSCPEDDIDQSELNGLVVGSTHGRDGYGRRLLPVMLKDVAGLVPGAYQGRGRGNKFLDDLTDADVLIHVLDASGTADTEGNAVGCIEDKDCDIDEHQQFDNGGKNGAGSHPLNDLAWVQNELIQWVYLNLESKWDNIMRRGRNKLVEMFSGYKQSQAFVWDVLLITEKYLLEHEGRDHALDHLSEWDAGDLHRLVAAFLGARFPMALALNKSDLPSAKTYLNAVLEALPVHGAHTGIPMSAQREMNFVRQNILAAVAPNRMREGKKLQSSIPNGVWSCLQSALRLREPVLAFPVSDMSTYLPLAGMTNFATRDSSLPSVGMISCLHAADGHPPSLWDGQKKIYVLNSEIAKTKQALRDVLTLKPGSTVEDVFLALKWMGALEGEYVRAEAAGLIGEKPKLVKKDDIIGRHNRILRIMTTKRREWQKKMG